MIGRPRIEHHRSARAASAQLKFLITGGAVFEVRPLGRGGARVVGAAERTSARYQRRRRRHYARRASGKVPAPRPTNRAVGPMNEMISAIRVVSDWFGPDACHSRLWKKMTSPACTGTKLPAPSSPDRGGCGSPAGQIVPARTWWFRPAATASPSTQRNCRPRLQDCRRFRPATPSAAAYQSTVSATDIGRAGISCDRSRDGAFRGSRSGNCLRASHLQAPPMPTPALWVPHPRMRNPDDTKTRRRCEPV